MDKHLLQYHSILSTPQDSLLHAMKQFITFSGFYHLFIKQFVLRFSSCYMKLQNNIIVTIFCKYLLIGLSHCGSFVNKLFSTKQCTNCALIFKVLNFALTIVFFPVTHIKANMPQSALCGCCCTGNT